jgi:hypothetical protein
LTLGPEKSPVPRYKAKSIIQQMSDIIFFTLGCILGFITSQHFHNIQEKLIASYVYENGDETVFVFEYENGYGKKRFSKRGLAEHHEQPMVEDQFMQIKESLVRRSIP